MQLRFEYDDVVAFHPYRTFQPWDNGGIRILQVDGVNGGAADITTVRAAEQHLMKDAVAVGLRAFADNHCGYTVRTHTAGRWTYYQVRFSDGSLYIWLMPGPP